MAEEIVEEIAGLDWKHPEEVQAASRMSVASRLGDDLSPLMMQNLQKTQWENAAEVLKNVEISKVVPFVPELLEWLKDINWPGAQKVFEIILKVHAQELLPHLDVAIAKAREETDKVWQATLVLLRQQMNERTSD